MCLADNSRLSHILFLVKFNYNIYDNNLLKLGMAVTKDMINEFNIFLQHNIFLQDKFYLFSFDRNLMNISSCFRLSYILLTLLSCFYPETSEVSSASPLCNLGVIYSTVNL